MGPNEWIAFGGLLFLVFIQTAGAFFFMGRHSARLVTVEREIKALKEVEKADGQQHGGLTVAVARLEVEVRVANDALAEIKHRLSMAPPTGYPA